MTFDDNNCIDLRCDSCNWSQTCDSGLVANWLRRAERLRRDQQPELDVMHEVLRAAAPELACPQCGGTGLVAETPAESCVDWPAAKTCDRCGAMIPPERLEVVPHATRCTSCQTAEDHGEGPAEFEYCPRCGAVMELQLSGSSGISRYVMKCTGTPPCR